MVEIDADLLAARANLVLQVNRSHLERVERFLRSHYEASPAPDAGGDAVATPDTTTSVADAPGERISQRSNCDESGSKTNIKILAVKKKTASKSCSLVFLHADDTKAFVEHLGSHYRFVLQGLNKVYAMPNERSIMKGSFAPIKESDVLDGKISDDCISHRLLELMQKLRCSGKHNKVLSSMQKSVAVKVGVFPIKLQSQLVANLTTLLDAKSIPESELDVTPSNQTHTLSVVEVMAGTYLVGVASAEQSASTIQKTNTTNDICRAFHKLSEAVVRYRHLNNSPFPLSKAIGSGSKRKTASVKPIIAVDCGSAPGGWTKCLIEQVACDEVYSIDPGEMDESVSSLPNVHHMKMTAEEAIPKLRDMLSQRDCAIALWVSDMCVHDIPKQVDMFLRAREQGIFRPDAAFVLTIKCNIGHTSKRFEALADQEAKRLIEDAGAYGINIMHLFNNRMGERTIVGFIK